MKEELWLVWKNPISRQRYVLGLLSLEDNIYTFKYIPDNMEDAINNGFINYPGFDDLDKIYKSDKLFANIETRLPNIGRPDYLEILNSYNLSISSTKLEILKATRGRLITDTYEFVPVFDKNKINFEIAGVRHCRDIEKCQKILSINDKLYLENDFSNKFDKYAIKILYKNNGKIYHIGYVPKYYSKQLSEILENQVTYSAMIESINFNSKIKDESIKVSVKLILK